SAVQYTLVAKTLRREGFPAADPTESLARLRARERFQRLGVATRLLEQPADRHQAPAHIRPVLRLDVMLPYPGLTIGEDLLMAHQCPLLLATLPRQRGQLEAGLTQRPPRFPIGLILQERHQPVVEVARRLEQPVAQRLELLFLEQEVFTDARVEGLN